jgi:hypothetical protein
VLHTPSVSGKIKNKTSQVLVAHAAILATPEAKIRRIIV